MKPKRITINDLAVMTKHGFNDMQNRLASKEDLKGFVTKDDFKVLVDEIRLLRADFRDIKTSMQSFAELAGTHEREIITIKRHTGMATR